MDANQYQKLAARTLIDKPGFEISKEDIGLTMDVLVLAHRVCQAVEMIKKGIYHQHGLDRDGLSEQFRDISTNADLLAEGVTSESFLRPEQIMWLWNVLGLIGESGEVLEEIVEAIWKDRKPNLTQELGDVQWYIAALATKLDLPLSDMMEYNVERLKRRYRNGYSAKESKERVNG